MKNKPNIIVTFRVCNWIVSVFFIAAIPGYYFFDYYRMDGVFCSCGIYLFLTLLQFVFYKNSVPMLIALVIFLVHILSRT